MYIAIKEYPQRLRYLNDRLLCLAETHYIGFV